MKAPWGLVGFDSEIGPTHIARDTFQRHAHALAPLEARVGDRVSLGDLMDEMADSLLAVVGPAVTETEVQVVGRLNPTPTPPSIDIYPGDPFRDTPTAAFGDVGGELLFTVRARVITTDNTAGQNLLLRLMDDTDDISVAATLMEDQTLNGLASSVYVEGNTGYTRYLDGGTESRRPARLRVARPGVAGHHMTATMAALTVGIDLGGCDRAHCHDMAQDLRRQLDPAYSRGAAVMPLLDSFQVYRSSRRTARKRANHAGRLGYRFPLIDRPDLRSDIHAINTSKPERQGRPMSAGYRTPPSYSPIEMVCPRHHVYTYGVLRRGHPRRLSVAVPVRRARHGLEHSRPRRPPQAATSCTCCSSRWSGAVPTRRHRLLQPLGLRRRRPPLLQNQARPPRRQHQMGTVLKRSCASHESHRTSRTLATATRACQRLWRGSVRRSSDGRTASGSPTPGITATCVDTDRERLAEMEPLVPGRLDVRPR